MDLVPDEDRAALKKYHNKFTQIAVVQVEHLVGHSIHDLGIYSFCLVLGPPRWPLRLAVYPRARYQRPCHHDFLLRLRSQIPKGLIPFPVLFWLSSALFSAIALFSTLTAGPTWRTLTGRTCGTGTRSTQFLLGAKPTSLRPFPWRHFNLHSCQSSARPQFFMGSCMW